MMMLIMMLMMIPNQKHKNGQNAQSTLMKTILTDFENYLKAPSKYKQNKKLKNKNVIALFTEIGINTFVELVEQYLSHYAYPSVFCSKTKVLENSNYNSYLRKWAMITDGN